MHVVWKQDELEQIVGLPGHFFLMNEKSQTVAGSPRRGTVLVVDDEDGPLQCVELILREYYDVFKAGDGTQAIEIAKEHQIDVAVLDVRMSGMSGIELLERLKYLDPNIEVVLMTAFETTDSMRQALRLRACDYISKPFDVSTLRASVVNAMQWRMLKGGGYHKTEPLKELLAEFDKLRRELETIRASMRGLNRMSAGIANIAIQIDERISKPKGIGADDLKWAKAKLKEVRIDAGNCTEIIRDTLGFEIRAPSCDQTSLNPLQTASEEPAGQVLVETAAAFLHKLTNEFADLIALARSMGENIASISESQRDSITQPRVARNELPWVTKPQIPSTLKGLHQSHTYRSSNSIS